jgi:hypothetical protein
LRPDDAGAFLVPASGQTGKPFFPQENRQGIDADAVTGLPQFSLDVVDRQVLLTHGHGELPNRIAGGSGLGAMPDRLKESVPFVGIMPEVMTQDAEGPGRIAKAGGHFARGDVLHEEAA